MPAFQSVFLARKKEQSMNFLDESAASRFPDQPEGPDAADRKCLGCGRVFRSAHSGNRICLACKTDEDEGWGSAWLREDFSIGRLDQALE